jgi:glycosyltransferase involved in cell wall biosynthesis
MKKRILFIPHHPETPGIKIRINEIAKKMAPIHDTFLLSWNSVLNEYSLKNRSIVLIKDLFKTTSLSFHDGMQVVSLPTLHRPVSLARWFNRRMLMRFIRDMKIDVVINGSYYLFTLPEMKYCKYIVDLADLPMDPSSPYVDLYTKKEAHKCDAITAASLGLVEYVKSNYDRDAQYLPNGLDLDKMKNVSNHDILDIKKKYNLVGKYIIGYIGNIGTWVNVELAVNAFEAFNKERPDAVMLWVGESKNLGHLQKKYALKNVIFTGGIHNNIETYFRAIDVGIIPTVKSPFQDMAFHLKLIEYTAAGKPIISTPLETSVKLGFPNIIFATENAALWTEALHKASIMKFQERWFDCADSYDWHAICEKLNNIIDSL